MAETPIELNFIEFTTITNKTKFFTKELFSISEFTEELKKIIINTFQTLYVDYILGKDYNLYRCKNLTELIDNLDTKATGYIGCPIKDKNISWNISIHKSQNKYKVNVCDGVECAYSYKFKIPNNE